MSSPESSAPKNVVARLELPSHQLQRLGAKHLIVKSDINKNEFEYLLGQLQEEKPFHTWSTNRFESWFKLRQYEVNLRPTHFFGYYHHDMEGKERLVAVGTVAEKLSHQSLVEGLPVIARSYLLPEFRGCGVYRQMLAHRFLFCQRLFGNRLKAIHIGTANESVKHSLDGEFGGSKFLFIGQEDLGDGEFVNDYLWLTPQFRAGLEKALNWHGEVPDCVRSLQLWMKDFLSNELTPHNFLRLKHLLVAVEKDTLWTPRSNRTMTDFVSFYNELFWPQEGEHGS